MTIIVCLIIALFISYAVYKLIVYNGQAIDLTKIASCPESLIYCSYLEDNMSTVVRTDDEIYDLSNRAIEIVDNEGSKYPGMSYEQGIMDALNWLMNSEEPNPLGDE